jgi:hypothetical protein
MSPDYPRHKQCVPYAGFTSLSFTLSSAPDYRTLVAFPVPKPLLHATADQKNLHLDTLSFGKIHRHPKNIMVSFVSDQKILFFV